MHNEIAVVWDAILFSLVDICFHFWRKVCLHHHHSILMLGAMQCNEVHLYEIIRRHISELSLLNTYDQENIKIYWFIGSANTEIGGKLDFVTEWSSNVFCLFYHLLNHLQKTITDEQHYIKSVIQSFNAFNAFSALRTHKESFGGSKMRVK